MAAKAIPGGAYLRRISRSQMRMMEGQGRRSSGFDYQYIRRKVAPTFKIPGGGTLRAAGIREKEELGVFIHGAMMMSLPWRWKIRAADFKTLQDSSPQSWTGAKGRRHHGDLGSIGCDPLGLRSTVTAVCPGRLGL